MIGKPAYVDPFMPAIANTAKSTAFGDWSRYFVRMVNGTSVPPAPDCAGLLRADNSLIGRPVKESREFSGCPSWCLEQAG